MQSIGNSNCYRLGSAPKWIHIIVRFLRRLHIPAQNQQANPKRKTERERERDLHRLACPGRHRTGTDTWRSRRSRSAPQCARRSRHSCSPHSARRPAWPGTRRSAWRCRRSRPSGHSSGRHSRRSRPRRPGRSCGGGGAWRCWGGPRSPPCAGPFASCSCSPYLHSLT